MIRLAKAGSWPSAWAGLWNLITSIHFLTHNYAIHGYPRICFHDLAHHAHPQLLDQDFCLKFRSHSHPESLCWNLVFRELASLLHRHLLFSIKDKNEPPKTPPHFSSSSIYLIEVLHRYTSKNRHGYNNLFSATEFLCVCFSLPWICISFVITGNDCWVVVVAAVVCIYFLFFKEKVFLFISSLISDITGIS